MVDRNLCGNSWAANSEQWKEAADRESQQIWKRAKNQFCKWTKKTSGNNFCAAAAAAADAAGAADTGCSNVFHAPTQLRKSNEKYKKKKPVDVCMYTHSLIYTHRCTHYHTHNSKSYTIIHKSQMSVQ